jgi:hypothetical protein
VAWKQRLLGLELEQLLTAPSMILAGWIGAPLYALGCWYGEVAPGVGIAFIGGVCAVRRLARRAL